MVNTGPEEDAMIYYYLYMGLLIVVLILAIAAAIVIPNIGSANDLQATSAAAVVNVASPEVVVRLKLFVDVTR